MSAPLPFRANVAALVLVGDTPEPAVLACERASGGIWQTPQGGVEASDTSLVTTLLRELEEEIGVRPDAVRVLSQSRAWRRYHFPPEVLAAGHPSGRVKDHAGQDQKWFLVRIPSLEAVDLARSDGEFRAVKLVSPRELISLFVAWKRPGVLDFCRESGLLV